MGEKGFLDVTQKLMQVADAADKLVQYHFCLPEGHLWALLLECGSM